MFENENHLSIFQYVYTHEKCKCRENMTKHAREGEGGLVGFVSMLEEENVDFWKEPFEGCEIWLVSGGSRMETGGRQTTP
jgi:hypothetical protein